MTAQIVQFPTAARTTDQLSRVGLQLRDALPLPSRDAELAMLTTMAEHLLTGFDDGLCDSVLARLEAWDQNNRLRASQLNRPSGSP